MRAGPLIFLLLLSPIILAEIPECSIMQAQERDGCYLAKSTNPSDCALITDVSMRDQCFLAIAEERAKIYLDCDRLYQEYQPVCYARITYQKDKNQMACENLVAEFKERCYIYYADRRTNGQISSCDTIPPQYKGSCLEYFFGKLSVKTENDCRLGPVERYQEECGEYVRAKQNAIAVSLSFIESALAFLTSQNTVMVGGLIIFLGISLFGLKVVSKAWKEERTRDK